jgi:hypothetical protein
MFALLAQYAAELLHLHLKKTMVNKLLKNADHEITEFCTFRGLMLEKSSPHSFRLAITLTLISHR